MQSSARNRLMSCRTPHVNGTLALIMIIKLIQISFVTCILGSISMCSTTRDISSRSISQNIKSILISEYLIDESGNRKDLPEAEFFVEYDKDGKETIFKRLNSRGIGDVKFDLVKESSYNADGKLTLVFEYYKYSNEPNRKDFSDSIEYHYNSSGLIKHKIYFKPSGWDVDRKWTYEYDSKKRLIKESLWNRYLSIRTTNPFAEIIEYTYPDDTIIKNRYVRDNLRSQTKMYQVKRDSVITTTYDFRSNPRTLKIIKHFTKNRKIDYVHKIEGNEAFFLKYNSSGDLTSKCKNLSSDLNECDLVNEYLYDKEGNWVSKTTFYNGQKTKIVIRKIEY